jgi:hypothetical protein
MVNDEGQLYTIEGIAAAALILTTVYLVLNSTMVFTPGETHIYDMQLEQIGNDVLAVMDQPTTLDTTKGPSTQSLLEEYVENYDKDGFRDKFREYSNTTTGTEYDNIQFNSNISYNDMGQVKSISFAKTGDYYRENAVKVTRWVNIDGSITKIPADLEPRKQTVLLEVLLWRG